MTDQGQKMRASRMRASTAAHGGPNAGRSDAPRAPSIAGPRRNWLWRGGMCAIAALAAGCAPMAPPKDMPAPDGVAAPTAPAEKGALPAPKVAAIALALTAADAGKTFTMRQGDRLSVSLVGVPTAGYLWGAPAPPAFLKRVDETSGPTNTAQLQPGFTGGTHWEVTVFQAIAPGKALLTFEQRRPWEKSTPPSDVWSATIEVK